jgi:hypothetical protein
MIEAEIIRETNVNPEVFEYHIFDTFEALGINKYAISGPPSDRLGYLPHKFINHEDFEFELRRWIKR